MTAKKQPPAGVNGEGAMEITQRKDSVESDTGQALGITFQGLASLKRWVPYKLVWNPKRDKFDKIPARDERSYLSTKDPNDWKTLIEAGEIARNGLSGVGFVTTGGLQAGNWTFIGFDFDDVDLKNFTPPFKTYAERSPSKIGVRMFAWVPTMWANRFQDTLNCQYANCAHCEIYLGTAPRFLTVTFDAINDEPIAQLTDADLKLIESWGMHDREAPAPAAAPDVPDGGKVIDLSRITLNADQKRLVDGTKGIDRSQVMMGFLIKLLDDGHKQEDVLATLIQTPATWQYLMDHRSNNKDKALEFAKDEIGRAYAKSKTKTKTKTKTGIRAGLIGFSEKWKPTPPKKGVAFPAPYPGPMADVVAAGLDAAHKPQPGLTTMATLSAMAAVRGRAA